MMHSQMLPIALSTNRQKVSCLFMEINQMQHFERSKFIVEEPAAKNLVNKKIMSPKKRSSKKKAKKSNDVEEDEGWAKCEAKRLLSIDIMEGTVTDDMDWQEVFWYRPEYAEISHRLFASRLAGLLGQISRASQRAARDDQALAHDRHLYPVTSRNHRDARLRWEGSAAEAWLKKDVASKKHESMEPKQLYAQPNRAAYRQFSLEVFRGHIYQEVQLQKYCTWRGDTNKPKANEWM